MSNDPEKSAVDEHGGLDFIRTIVEDDLAAGKHQEIQTRFPPEPNGYLHIGHAKAICLNFGLAEEYPGRCNLRFDDTNPSKENVEYVNGIQQDVRWLGFDWEDRLYFASDYFDRLYELAQRLIRKGRAYVDSLSAEEIRSYRGTPTEPGRNSPQRDRSVEENLDLFERMKNGEFAEGTHVLRAKIDMASGNLNFRDPTLYRILHAKHHRTGDTWKIYPMYDFTHPLSDAFEGVTHSLCTLEFESHRPLYDWMIEHTEVENTPRQIEFARLNLGYTVVSKRKLKPLVDSGVVDGWDDPRMPTISALRRRGYTPEAIREFCKLIGLAKRDSLIDYAQLVFCIRQDLNKRAPRRLGVLDPIKVVVENYPEDQEEWFDAVNNPEDENAGSRKIPFTREFYIDREDFREEAPKKYYRMKPGQEVRLRYAYYVTCTDFVKNEDGDITEVRCSYDPESRGGNTNDGRRVRGTIHWVSAKHAVDAEVRLYEQLFTRENLSSREEGKEIEDYLNPESLTVLKGCKLEPSATEWEMGTTIQLERKGYFCLDSKLSRPDAIVLNRTTSLRDSWGKLEGKIKA